MKRLSEWVAMTLLVISTVDAWLGNFGPATYSLVLAVFVVLANQERS